ncbi:RsmB/NOP family class I SAM-dependent RNA methyltransferase [Falsirhodobacter sp. alg1]|uniref:RsmB/NOP family class I SAM-dependent RNA methyltransferase n=1 Tax=Falsirhodobacter sp. alg1 TaxID=1472418 RepID=UPI0005EEA76D|nr:RsmB/NOP family class I SAM-dependent RNA methyltransferase [Falsirhodobacter sp. alg1]
MTPAARLSASIEILDRWLAGVPAEKALVNWARASRFAGSGDRNAVRDLVFDAIRCRRSFAALGGSETGRGLILGGLRARGEDPVGMFTGEGHAPAPVAEDETGHTPEGGAALDCPEWLAAQLESSLGGDFAPVMEALRHRAPVFLRAVGNVEAVRKALAAEGIMTEPHPLAAKALEVKEGARKILQSKAYASGKVELQDAASQAVVELLPLADNDRVLDFCAGGGGKTLAMATRARLKLVAHDSVPRRMADFRVRAERAGVRVGYLDTAAALSETYDLVLVDAPCSGSGSWRRSPEGKWALTPERLNELTGIQDAILKQVRGAVQPGGYLAYATCSLLDVENKDRIEAFLSGNPDWKVVSTRTLTPLDGGDGFFVSLLQRQA